MSMQSTTARTGGRILVDQLALHGADLAFCVPGESFLPVLDALYEARSRIRLITCRHEGGADFRSGKKPEALLEIILRHFSRPGDLVLDAFAGSGTTDAVTHKIDRRWIMIELEQHCHTHIIPRLRKVIDGQDATGVSAAVGWKGGGGFRYYQLVAEPVLPHCEFGHDDYSRAVSSLPSAPAEPGQRELFDAEGVC